MKNNHLGIILLVISLIINVNLVVGQIKNTATTVLIKHDFQEDTFEENDKKFAREYFDKLCVQVQAKLKADIATDKTLGISFEDKNATAICQISFYTGKENEEKVTYFKMSLIDNINKYEIEAWRYPYLKNKATNLKEAIEENKENLDRLFDNHTFHTLFGAFCSNNQPDLLLQQRYMKKYRNTIIMPLAKKSKFQIIHNIATNSLISANYSENRSVKDHLGVFVLPSTSAREKEDIAVSLRIKEDKDFIIVYLAFFGKDVNLVTPIEVKTTVKIDKARFYSGDYTEANYMIGDVFDKFVAVKVLLQIP